MCFISVPGEKIHVWEIIRNPEILPVIISVHITENKNGRKTQEEKGILFLGCT